MARAYLCQLVVFRVTVLDLSVRGRGSVQHYILTGIVPIGKNMWRPGKLSYFSAVQTPSQVTRA